MRAGSTKFSRVATRRSADGRACGVRLRVRRVSSRGEVAVIVRRPTPHLIPLLARHASERLDHFGVELCARVLVEFRSSHLVRLSAAIDSFSRDGFEGVCAGDYTPFQVYPSTTTF